MIARTPTPMSPQEIVTYWRMIVSSSSSAVVHQYLANGLFTVEDLLGFIAEFDRLHRAAAEHDRLKRLFAIQRDRLRAACEAAQYILVRNRVCARDGHAYFGTIDQDALDKVVVALAGSPVALQSILPQEEPADAGNRQQTPETYKQAKNDEFASRYGWFVPGRNAREGTDGPKTFGEPRQGDWIADGGE